jgi:hypothetical protein
MNIIRTAAACLSLVATGGMVTAAIAASNHVEYKLHYWDSSSNRWVGESWFYCDGTIETYGMVTGESTEEYIQACS